MRLRTESSISCSQRVLRADTALGSTELRAKKSIFNLSLSALVDTTCGENDDGDGDDVDGDGW